MGRHTGNWSLLHMSRRTTVVLDIGLKSRLDVLRRGRRGVTDTCQQARLRSQVTGAV